MIEELLLLPDVDRDRRQRWQGDGRHASRVHGDRRARARPVFQAAGEHVAILARGQTSIERRPLREPAPHAPAGCARRLAEVERASIEEALRAEGGSRTRAALKLGISLRSLLYKLEKYGVGR